MNKIYNYLTILYAYFVSIYEFLFLKIRQNDKSEKSDLIVIICFSSFNKGSNQ
jgi:hypothetical protein